MTPAAHTALAWLTRASVLFGLSAVALVLGACGSGYRARALPDGSWRVECVDQVERCLREAERTCGGDGYSVISGAKDTKLYGGKTGYQTAADLHVIEFRCGSAPEPPPSLEASRGGAEEAAPESAAQEAHGAAAICTPGATQRCIGPGACEGGQSCNAEGSGFLPCDCGDAAVPAPAPESAGSDETPQDAAE